MAGTDMAPRTPPSRLGGMVRRRRDQLGLSTREAARRIGISPSYLVALEQGRNPSTDRAPVPSPTILMSIGQVLGIELGALLDAVGAAPSGSVHLLLYQSGSAHRPPIAAARRLFGDRVDAWIEVTDPRAGDDPAPDDVLVRVHGPLGSPPSQPRVHDGLRVLAALSELLANAPNAAGGRRVGIVFGANSALLRSAENPLAVLESEATWEHDVAEVCRHALSAAPAANVCVYREADLEELAARLDPLAAVLGLIRAHPRVAVQGAHGEVTTGPAAVETILSAARPAGISSETWDSLVRAAAVGLART
jgi:transcriptional regulator with XRE-family HTH domain